jgi:hypothetical protein
LDPDNSCSGGRSMLAPMEPLYAIEHVNFPRLALTVVQDRRYHLCVAMPRLITARNAVIFVNVLVLTALFVHLKFELLDKNASGGGPAGLTHLPDELYDEQHTNESSHSPKEKPLKANGSTKTRRTAVVVASQRSENATWLNEFFPRWEKNIYRVDDSNAPLTVPKNKGRESMVYLTYALSSYSCNDSQTNAGYLP